MDSVLVVNVKRTHIDNGQSEECMYCAVELAVLDTVKGAWAVGVGYRGMHYSNGETMYSYACTEPLLLEGWIRDHDADRLVQPITFRFRLQSTAPLPPRNA